MSKQKAAEKGDSHAPREMTGAEMVIQALADQGVECLFGYPGGAVLPIYDALFGKQDQVNDILEILYLFNRRINLGPIEKDLMISESP